MVAAGPAGDPGGKPSAGSARKMPATTSPTPNVAISRAVQRRPQPDRTARRTPTATATTITPVTRKLVIWIHPRSPLDSTLAGCRRRSNPSRVNAWASHTATYSGPATTPHPSSDLVTPSCRSRVVVPCVWGAIVWVISAVLVYESCGIGSAGWTAAGLVAFCSPCSVAGVPINLAATEAANGPDADRQDRQTFSDLVGWKAPRGESTHPAGGDARCDF